VSDEDSNDPPSDTMMSKIQTYWPIFVAVVVAVVWVTSTVVSASLSVASVKSDVEINRRDIAKGDEKVENHQKTVRKVNNRLITVETDIKHIRVQQKQNHEDIKSELRILRQDIKKMSN